MYIHKFSKLSKPKLKLVREPVSCIIQMRYSEAPPPQVNTAMIK